MATEPEPGNPLRADRELNCRGMSCPLPVLYAREALARMPTGEVLMVVASDPGTVVDFVEFSRRDDHTELVGHRDADGDYIFWFRKT
jgi:tRNA 2-thiouridine synthesizing protein A